MSKDVILTPEQIAAEERRWLFDAPIAELAEVKGVTVDEAVKLRTDRKSTRLNSSHPPESRMPSSA